MSDDELFAKFKANVSYVGMFGSKASLLAQEITAIDAAKDMTEFEDSLGTAASLESGLAGNQ